MNEQAQTWKPRFKIGFIAGLGAGVVATGVMLLLNYFAGGISLPEVLGSVMTALMPAAMFDYLHQTFGPDSKHYLFYGIVVGQCLVFALSGAVYNLFLKKMAAPVSARKKARKADEAVVINRNATVLDGLQLAGILWLAVGLLFLPLTGSGFFGSQLSIGIVSTMISLAVVGVVFGLLFVFFQSTLVTRSQPANQEARRQARENGEEPAFSRRSLIKGGLIGAGVILLGVGAWRFITEGVGNSTANVATLLQNFKSKIVPPPVPKYGTIQPAPGLSSEITSNDQYYVVSKNLFADPTVDANSWNLTVDGLVDHPFTLTYPELLNQPMQTQYESMMCISNEVGGQYMSNALWKGVPLKDLLQQAGVKPGAIKVIFHAADDYTDSIHLDKALEQTTLLAVYMNGATLPQGHGFPARMLVPGIYGMKHCKWLTRIEVTNQNYQGYWQQRGWDDAAPIRLTARIDTPQAGASASVNQTTYIAGVAFSGNKGISEVDVSVDGGQTWQVATLKQPPSEITWVLWEYAWSPTSAGTYTIVARAIDLEGNVQDPNVEPPAPIGSSGYESFDISVA
ncbi:MAG TPA: molybdopterin-dependent oxidoreductase [Ktedonobacteraceae bacterium]|nr:molybdopterin-dependent oxidoreductase [Ktedonobacteraceae bacterium]